MSHKLKAKNFEKDFFEERQKIDLDYTSYGQWQGQYTWQTLEVIQKTDPMDLVIDVGCACGNLVKGFRDTLLPKRTIGYDVSEYMLQQGRNKFGHGEDLIKFDGAHKIPLLDACVDVYHSQQVYEHIPEELIGASFAEARRVIKPGGVVYICLAALKDLYSEEAIRFDPTHITIHRVVWWMRQAQKAGFVFDLESYDRLARSHRKPNKGARRNYWQRHTEWTTLILKPI